MSPVKWDRRVVIVGSAALFLMAGATFVLLPRPAEEAVAVEEPPEIEIEATELREVRLYFPGDDGRLHVLTRELAVSREATENVGRLVEALLAGPHGEHAAADAGGKEREAEELESEEELEPEDGLWPPFPAGIDLGRTFLLDDATVVLDLVSPESGRPSTGSKMELLMLHSLVNTVLENVDEAERVMVLWNGRQPSTFAGHVDATRPFVASSELVAPGGAS
jgi:hypothetical protein